VRALAAVRSAVFSASLAALVAFFAFFPLSAFKVWAGSLWTAVMTWSSSSWAYQMPIVPICVKPAIAWR
jgi:hypothetical protein